MKKLLLGISLISLAFLSGCGTLSLKKGDKHALNNDWTKAVLEYRAAYKANPGNVEAKSKLQQAELRASEYYYQKGIKLLEQDNLDPAIVQFQQGLVAMPDSSKLQQVMKLALSRKESGDLYLEAMRNLELNKTKDAIRLLNRALNAYPDNKRVAFVLEKITQQKKKQDDDEDLALNSKDPITLNFKKTELKTAFGFITKSFGVNVIFDEAVKSVPVTLYAKNVTFEQALNLMLRTTQTFYKKIGRNTILIAPDTQAKHGQYEDHIIRTYHLTSISSKEMSSILKNVLGIKKIVINEELNSIIIRDTDEMLELAGKLIDTNDRKPAEMILEVEILEINRTKAETLGLDFGSLMTSSYEPFVGSFKDGITHGTVTVPNITLNYFKQDVDAKTLANPKIRVIDNKKAKIHIGDRVPLRSATITDTGGGTTTSYEYRDIGIRLQVSPDIHLDNSVTVELNLEVSTLGQNLGTADQPAYSIGTRNADSFMLLKDGETAILGGLIRDEDRRSRIRLPGLGDIPILGALFSTFDDSVTRTDVLLTITPRIVRTWDIPDKSYEKIFSGTEKQYSTQPMFAFLGKNAKGSKSEIIDVAVHDAMFTTDKKGKLEAKSTSVMGNLSFNEPVYTVNKNEPITVELVAEGINDISNMPLELMFNPNLLEYVQSEAVDIGQGTIEVSQDPEKGVVRLNLKNVDKSSNGKTVIARLTFNGKNHGVSYLVYKSLNYTSKTGKQHKANIRASRIVIK